jgi:hypothetical protein
MSPGIVEGCRVEASAVDYSSIVLSVEWSRLLERVLNMLRMATPGHYTLFGKINNICLFEHRVTFEALSGTPSS